MEAHFNLGVLVRLELRSVGKIWLRLCTSFFLLLLGEPLPPSSCGSHLIRIFQNLKSPWSKSQRIFWNRRPCGVI